MEYALNQDIISELPQSIIEIILTKLPIRDALKTSVLSTRWRYKWCNTTDLVFDDKCAILLNDNVQVEDSLVKFITRCLFLHLGPIHKFSLSSSFLQTSPDVDQWLLFLSRNNIKELFLELGEGEWFRAPSSLFCCRNLTRLDLIRCELDPPPKFKGFSCLKYLNLQQVLIAPDAVENLISSCPLLESLTLSYFDSLALTVRAPNLKFLCLEGEFQDICLENTPLLVAISVAMYMTDDIAEHILVAISVAMYMTDDIADHFEQSSSCNFDKFLGGAPCLERLVGHIYFTKYLSIGNDLGKLMVTYRNLKAIELYQVSFEDMEIYVVLRLIFYSPNLEDSKSRSVISNLSLGEEHPHDCTFEQLKIVKMTDMSNVPHEMEFIKFILRNSSKLETMTISPSVYVREGRLSLLIELVRFCRASAQVEIVFLQD